MNLEPSLNRTGGFYRGDAPSLLWELTVCQSLGAADSPYRHALVRPAPYGALVARFLADRLGTRSFRAVVEVGGGYGTLMTAFLAEARADRVDLVDLSPRFLAEQRKALVGRPGVRFVEADGAAFFRDLDRVVDLVIANEILGDLPTAVGLRPGTSPGDGDGLAGRVARTAERYGLDLAGAPDPFAFNLGAVAFLEAVAGKARAVLVTEHSCDPVLGPPYGFLPRPEGDGWPRRVALKDHDEYTIRFDHLERVALALGFRVERFPLAELVGLRHDDAIRSVVRSRGLGSERAELLYELCEHVAEYQGLLLSQ